MELVSSVDSRATGRSVGIGSKRPTGWRWSEWNALERGVAEVMTRRVGASSSHRVCRWQIGISD